MGEALAKAERARKKARRGRGGGLPELSPGERAALHKMHVEARRAGAKLQNGGRGGLPTSLVLGVMRRDGYRCKVHGDRGEGENGGLTIHHKSGVVESKWAAKKGHANVANNLVTVCAKGHDEIHERARDKGVDASQVTAEADEGTRHDRGQPIVRARDFG